MASANIGAEGIELVRIYRIPFCPRNEKMKRFSCNRREKLLYIFEWRNRNELRMHMVIVLHYPTKVYESSF